MSGWLIPLLVGAATGVLSGFGVGGGTLLLVYMTTPVSYTHLIRPLLDKWSLEHDTIYAITNYRVLALVKNNLMYIPLGRILTHSIEARDGESGNLCFCEAVGQSSSKMLDNAILGVRCGSPVSYTHLSSSSL